MQKFLSEEISQFDKMKYYADYHPHPIAVTA